jgi:hypothetical protein
MPPCSLIEWQYVPEQTAAFILSGKEVTRCYNLKIEVAGFVLIDHSLL